MDKKGDQGRASKSRDDGSWTVIMSAVEPRYLPERDYEEIMADEGLPVGHRRMVAVYFSMADICNGGFDQYFFNGFGVLTIPAIEAYEKAGEKRMAEIMRLALKFCVERNMSPQRELKIPPGYLDQVSIHADGMKDCLSPGFPGETR